MEADGTWWDLSDYLVGTCFVRGSAQFSERRFRSAVFGEATDLL
jgi:hypothetical protein